MQPSIHRTTWLACLAWSLAACAATPAVEPESIRGWYLQGAMGDRLLACDGSAPWLIATADGLHAKARAFGLAADTPVYVVLSATKLPPEPAHPRRLAVEEVIQFGSPVPVRDCPLDGVVLPAPD